MNSKQTETKERKTQYPIVLWFTSRKQAVDFDICKRNLLLKLDRELDKSKKGSVDAPIVDLVEYLNKTHDYCTTSSCSGRFAIFCAAYNDIKQEQVSVYCFLFQVIFRRVVNGYLWSITPLIQMTWYLQPFLIYQSVKELHCLSWNLLCFMCVSIDLL
jgi:tRNA wybutosine-synthesizing protein 3